MSDFLAGYGVEEERRERLIKRALLVLLALLLGGGAFYLGFRTYPARRQVNQFLEYLKQKDYRSAYRLWGCTETSPCRDYTFEKFMEDWGPTSPHGQPEGARIRRMSWRACGPGFLYMLGTLAARAFGECGCDCGSGVIHTVAFPGGEEVALWYERKDKTLGFAPWPACLPPPKAWQ